MEEDQSYDEYIAEHYEFMLRNGYGSSKMLLPEDIDKKPSPSGEDYTTYYDLALDIHFYSNCPSHSYITSPEERGPFDGRLGQSWLEIIYGEFCVVSALYTAETYIAYRLYDLATESMGLADDERLEEYLRSRENAIQAQMQAQRACWAVFLNKAEAHDDDMEIVLSCDVAMHQIRIAHYMHDLEALETDKAVLDAIYDTELQRLKQYFGIE